METKNNSPNWKKIRSEYVKGGISQQKLAEKHGVSYATLRRRAEREKWRELKIEREHKVAEKLPEKLADVQAETAAKLLQMQSEAALVIYGKLMGTLKTFPDGVGTKNVRETVEVKKIKVNGEDREFPLHKTFTNDLEAVVRSMSSLAKLFGLDAASQQSRERFEMQKRQEGGASPEEANANILSIAELINHPMPDRRMEDVETEGDDDDD